VLENLPVPSSPVPGLGDRLQAGLLGFANSAAPIAAVANLISGLMTGQRTDAQGRLLAQQAATISALRSAGIPDPETVAMLHPALMRVLLGRLPATLSSSTGQDRR
jgi:hypothetical protein